MEMPNYCVNANSQSRTVLGGEEHEVHDLTPGACNRLPNSENRIPLGSHPNCDSALRAAGNLVTGKVDGCYYCCNPCHTG